MSSFFAAFKRRNVFRVGVAYAIVAWLVIQVAETVFPALKLPDWTITLVTALLIIGFPFAIFFAWVYELTPEGVKAVPTGGPAEYHTRTTGQRLNYFITGLLALAVIYLVTDKYVINETPATATVESVTEEPGIVIEPLITAKPADLPSVAVLPFADMSPDKDQEYFSDGLSEELLNKLAQLDGLLVAGRTSAFAFKGRNEDLRTIGETLNCGYILEGSVRRSADSLRITAQLINTTDGYHVWSETYDRELTDIFTIQDEIAEAVATAMSITLGVGELGRMEGGTRNLEAYEEFLKAQHQLNTSQNVSTVFQSAIAHLRRAVELDPRFVTAWLELYSMYIQAPTFTRENVTESRKNAAVALDRAQAIAPGSPAVLIAMAGRHVNSGEWLQAEHLYLNALESSGDSNLELLTNYGSFLAITGRLTEASDYFQRVRRIDPLGGIYDLAMIYASLEQLDDAFAEYERVISQQQINPTFPYALRFIPTATALVDAWATHDVELIAEWDRRSRESGWQGMAGAVDTQEETLAALKENYTNTGSALSKTVSSHWAAYLGDAEFSLQAMRDAVSEYDSGGIGQIWRLIYQDVRQLPGFKAVLSDLGLVDYWRSTGKWPDLCHPAGPEDFECE